MSEVLYAGPENKEPGAPPAAPTKTSNDQWSNQANDSKPYVTVRGAEAKLHLQSTPPGLTFHREDSSAVAYGTGGVARATGYARLCTSPCDISLPAGTETLAVSNEGGSPVSAGPVSIPAGESTLVATYKDNHGVRLAGYGVMIAGAVVGTVLIGTSFHTSCYDSGACDKPFDTTQFLIGMGVILGGGAVGLGLASVSDSATVQPAFNAERQPASIPERLPESHARLTPPGLGLRGTF